MPVLPRGGLNSWKWSLFASVFIWGWRVSTEVTGTFSFLQSEGGKLSYILLCVPHGIFSSTLTSYYFQHTCQSDPFLKPTLLSYNLYINVNT